MTKQARDERVVILQRDLEMLHEKLHNSQDHLKRIESAAQHLDRGIKLLAHQKAKEPRA